MARSDKAPGGGGGGGGGGGPKGGGNKSSFPSLASFDSLGPISGDGTSGSDWIYGTENADIIDAGAGDDLIVPGIGNDTIAGGDGTDIVVYDFVMDPDSFEVTEGKGQNKGSAIVTYSVDGTEYTDTLTGVEYIIHGDTTAVGDPPAATIDFDTGFDYYDVSDSSAGAGSVILSYAGYLVFATTTASGGTLEDPSARVTNGSGDLDPDKEFHVFTEANGTTHEINIQSAFSGATFDVVSIGFEGVEETDDVIISYVDAFGTHLPGITISGAAGVLSDGLLTMDELTDEDAAKLQGIAQLIIEAGADDDFYVDDITLLEAAPPTGPDGILNFDTGFGIEYASAAVGTGDVILADEGFYALATSGTYFAEGVQLPAGLDDPGTRLGDYDGDGDDEFRVWSDGNQGDTLGYTSHELNLQSVTSLEFSVTTVTISGIDANDDVFIYIVDEDGGPAVEILSFTGGSATQTIDVGSYIDGATTDDLVDQLIFEVGARDEVYIDDITFAIA